MARATDQFKEVLESCGLLDLGSKGQKFTRHRHIHGVCHIAKWFDRALSNHER